MIVLAFDLTSEYGSLALTNGCTLLAHQQLHSQDGFAHIVFGAIARLLGQARISLHDVDCFAAAAGPGAFTGVRVGLAAAKGLAEAEGKKAVGVSNLQAVACLGSSALRAPVLDARRGDVFGAVYDAELNLLTPETVGRLSEFVKSTSGKPVEFLSQNPEWLQAQLNAPVTGVSRYLAKAVADCALLALQRGAEGNPALLDANYVRRSDAELSWRE